MRLILVVLSSLIFFPSFSQEQFYYQGKDEVYSEYGEGRYFHTYCVCMVKAPCQFANEVLDEVFQGMRTAPTSNLEWAFHGLGDVGAKEDMLLYEKGVSHDPGSSEYILNLLVVMKNEKEMQVQILGELKKYLQSSGGKTVSLDLTKKVKILQDGIISITAIPHTDNTSIVTLHSQLQFGWFFNLFFTQNRYKNIMEWRFDGFLKNVRNRIENKSKEAGIK